MILAFKLSIFQWKLNFTCDTVDYFAFAFANYDVYGTTKVAIFYLVKRIGNYSKYYRISIDTTLFISQQSNF